MRKLSRYPRDTRGYARGNCSVWKWKVQSLVEVGALIACGSWCVNRLDLLAILGSTRSGKEHLCNVFREAMPKHPFAILLFREKEIAFAQALDESMNR